MMPVTFRGFADEHHLHQSGPSRMASASMVISTMFPTTIPPFQGRHSTSVGESNAVFLRGVGGDAATEPHKTGCSGYPEEEFSGTHMDLNASMFKPGESIRRVAQRSPLRPQRRLPPTV